MSGNTLPRSLSSGAVDLGIGDGLFLRPNSAVTAQELSAAAMDNAAYLDSAHEFCDYYTSVDKTAMDIVERLNAGGLDFSIVYQGMLIGRAAMDRSKFTENLGILFCWVAEDFRGRGIAPKASANLLAEAFFNNGFEVVGAGVRPENTPSKRVLTKLGFNYEFMLPDDSEFWVFASENGIEASLGGNT